MRHLFAPGFIGALSCLSALLIAPRAHADLSACGNIDVDVNASCQAVVQGGCDVACRDLKYDLSCHARGYLSCKGQCSGSVNAGCEASCDIQGCQAACNAHPPQFDCEANCAGDCGVNCSGSCSSQCHGDAGCQTNCEGSCKATCQGECHASCSGTAGSLDCKARCQASCQGQCRADAQIECQTNCQGSIEAGCEQELSGGCVARCQTPRGFVRCRDEFVDNNGNAQACLDAIEQWKSAIHLSASGSASCSNGFCNAQGEASCHCATPSQSGAIDDASALFGAGALGIGIVLRRRRRAEMR